MREIVFFVFILLLSAKRPVGFDELRMNHIRARGTHNSYHKKSFFSNFIKNFNFEHPRLATQLELGIRQLELDIHWKKTKKKFFVHHAKIVDGRTHCRKFTTCLKQIKKWSDKNRDHAPILIWLEPKKLYANLFMPQFSAPEKNILKLDKDILSVFPLERIITPDNVRGDFNSLNVAIMQKGWPNLSDVRGKVYFALLNDDDVRDRYLGKERNLYEKILFVDSDNENQSFAALFKINNALDSAARISHLAKLGFIITSNVDSIGSNDSYNYRRVNASLDSGVHYLSADAIVPHKRGFLKFIFGKRKRKYWLQEPKLPICHPLTGPLRCGSESISI